MKHLLKVIEIQHIRDGKVIWEDKNLYNTLHTLAEQYFLSVLFGGVTPPANYFMGLDNRGTITVDDTMESLVDEPTANGYLRQQVSSSSGWNIQQVTINETNIYQAIGSIITFQANGGSWGPVNNLFMTTTSDNSGVLLASVILSQEVTLNSGDSINMRMSLSLRDAPLT
jgi:hypothetical protein